MSTDAVVDPPDDPTRSTWQRFLDGKTTAQRLFLAIGALAGALSAIIGLIVGGAALLGDDDEAGIGAAGGKVQIIENQSSEADEFVTFLLSKVGGSPVQLDHKVLAPQGPGGEFHLNYSCASTGRCNLVRLETPTDTSPTIDGGVWYQGCWTVEKDGLGYEAEHLDIELRKQGEVCPS